MAFTSFANNLVAGDGPSFANEISADGRHAVFDSRATNLVDGDTNGESDVFAWDQSRDVS